MDIVFLCAWLFIFVFLCCCIKGAILLLFERDETELRTPNSLPLCCSLSFPSGSCAHRSRENRPPKPAQFMSSSARVKTNNFLYFSATAACVVIGTATLIYMASNGMTTLALQHSSTSALQHSSTRQPLCQLASALVPLGMLLLPVLWFMWLKSCLLVSSTCPCHLDHTCTYMRPQTCFKSFLD
jgi:hypothetical protein